MGERVVVDPERVSKEEGSGDSVHAAHGTTSDAHERGAGVPLEYARRDVPPWWAEQMKGLVVLLKELVVLLGGVRQVWFALGLAFVLGGIGAAMDRWASTSLMMWIGGLFLGLAIRVPRGGRRHRAGK